MSKDLLVLADEYAAATATFARALALKDSADSMSPIAREAGDKRAVLAEALAALDTAQPVQANEWKAAVIDALVAAHILTPENAIYPRKAVQDVIDWNCQVALDPRVSSKAQALVDSGKSVQVNAMLVEALEQAQPERAPLSDDEIQTIYLRTYDEGFYGRGLEIAFARAIEAAIKQGGQHD